MSNVTIQQAQAMLAELIHQLRPGEEVVITENNQPVARLMNTVERAQGKPRQLGTLRGSVQYVAPDFDAALEDFKDYVE